ncbi:hypothetical protein V5O48_003784 [Marasmius crinis-equi]|uniref:Uncharacterized protein n=1 Tax=Marasmius crinis-equi TaxID=585013 RepID=A0ABR3FRX2_9AGAR
MVNAWVDSEGSDVASNLPYNSVGSAEEVPDTHLTTTANSDFEDRMSEQSDVAPRERYMRSNEDRSKGKARERLNTVESWPQVRVKPPGDNKRLVGAIPSFSGTAIGYSFGFKPSAPPERVGRPRVSFNPAMLVKEFEDPHDGESDESHRTLGDSSLFPSPGFSPSNHTKLNNDILDQLRQLQRDNSATASAIMSLRKEVESMREEVLAIRAPRNTTDPPAGKTRRNQSRVLDTNTSRVLLARKPQVSKERHNTLSDDIRDYMLPLLGINQNGDHAFAVSVFPTTAEVRHYLRSGANPPDISHGLLPIYWDEIHSPWNRVLTQKLVDRFVVEKPGFGSRRDEVAEHIWSILDDLKDQFNPHPESRSFGHDKGSRAEREDRSAVQFPEFKRGIRQQVWRDRGAYINFPRPSHSHTPLQINQDPIGNENVEKESKFRY